jgi:hypothetical protein
METTGFLKSLQVVIKKVKNMSGPKKNTECHNYTTDCNIGACPFANSSTLPEYAK